MILRFSLTFWLVGCCASRLLADVSVTEPVGGNNVSADLAQNSSNGGDFASLGNIVVTEGAKSDFAVGTNRTFILTGPAGWRFDTAAGSVSFQNGGDITAASISVSPSSITVTISVGGISKSDGLTISGVRVQPLDGTQDPNAGFILRLSANPGTAGIAGIQQDSTTFGLLNTVPGRPQALELVTPPSTTATAGLAFDVQPEVMTYDQFGNQCYLDNATAVTANLLTGAGALQGTTNLTVIGGGASFSDLSENVANTITILFTATGLPSVTSAPVLVGPGAASRLAFATQPGLAQSGTPFAVQPVVVSQDAFGNNSTLGLPASQTVSIALASGTGPLIGPTNLDIGTSAGNGLVSYTNLQINATGTNKQLTAISPGLTNGLSSVFPVTGAQFAKLLLLAPGESFTPGTSPGKTGTPMAQTAGTAFSLTVNAVDAGWNLVTNATDAVGITSSDPNALLPPAASLVSGTQDFNVTLKTAGNAIITASDLTDGTRLAGSSGPIGVAAGAFLQLQLLAPGESAAPGTASGKTGTPSAQTASNAFNVVVVASDSCWNVVNTVADTVGITSSDAQATLPPNAALVAGAVSLSVMLNTPGSATLTASDLTEPSIQQSTSPPIVVYATSPSKLTIDTQPSSVATAGVAFSQQPVLRVEDANGNLVGNDNGRVITATRGTGTGALQGTVTATTVAGVATFTNLSYKVAETITINFTTGGLTNAISSNVVVGPAAADRLAFTTQPGGLSRAGSPLATQPVVKTKDPFGNVSTVGLPATLNLALALNSGSGSLLGTTTCDIGTAAGNGIAICTNLQCSVAGTNKQLSAFATGLASALSSSFTVGGVEPAVGGSAISADTAGATYTALTGPVYYEAASGDAGTGTIILNPPIGFGFDTGGTAPSVIITRLAGAGGNSNNIDGVATGTAVAITSRATNQITLTVSNASSGGATCSLTWTNVRVRPNLGTPLASGSVTRSGTAVMAAVTAGSTSLGTLVETAGVANRLAFTTQPGSAVAGTVFGAQPAVQSRDQFGNNSSNGLPASRIVSVALSSGTGALLGGANLDIGTAAGNGFGNWTSLQLNAAGTNKQLTASASGLTNALSSVFTVSPAAASRLTIQTQPSLTATAGVSFAAQPVIRVEDGFGNLISSDNSTVVTASRVSGTSVLQGTANRTAIAGVVSFTDLSYRVAETITLGFAGGSLASATSSNVVVSPAAASRLTIQTQPSATATAGVIFAQQPVIRSEDQFGNLRSSDNSTAITATRGSGTGTLQGPTTATTAAGVASFSNLSYPVAETMTVLFSSGSLTNATSSAVLVKAAPFAKLQLLAPGESAAPGTVSGKTGTPAAQIASTTFNVTVNAVDTNWNVVTNSGDTVGITASSASASLPANSSLVNGMLGLPIAFSTNGSFNLTATDLTDGSKTAATSSAITVGAAQFSPAAGGSAISADTAASPAFTSLTGPSYSENANGNVGTGTIILKSQSGFIFDTGGTAPTVLIARLGGSGSSGNNINGVSSGIAAAMTSVSSTQMVFTVTRSSVSGVTCKLTWQNVRVRPAAGTPLAMGSLVVGGTANVVGVSTNSNFGALREVAGAANNLVIQVQPSAAATAGVMFGQQPVIQVRDQFGNLRSAANGSADNNTVVTAARSAGSGTLQGATSLTAANGVVTFTNLSHNVATNITISFSASGVSATNSSAISVSPAAADHLVFTTQPGSTTYGSALSVQPVLKARDPFGNDSTVGLGASEFVTLSVSAGTGSLLGSTSLDIGTGAGNGVAAFSGLTVSAAGTNKQLSASASGLSSALSGTFAVNPTSVTGSITANSKIYDGSTAAAIASRTLSGVLAGDNVSLSGGTASFASKSVGTAKTVTASGLSLSGLAASNYQLASTTASATADIAVRSLTVSATGVNKAYDGTTSATVTLSDNRVAGDSLTANYISTSFADRNVGTAKSVSVSGIAITGTDAANYSANTTASTAADITARSLNVTATGSNKVYDGTTSATVTLSDNRVAGDSLSTSYTSAGFANKSAGTNKTVSVSGISVSGTDAANYTFTSTASATASISARSLSVTATGSNKVYDGSATATVTLVDNRLAGDSLSTSYTNATFANKNVGSAKTVSVSGIAVSGTDAANYTANTTASTSADITARPLNVTATGVNKVYDGTTSATVTLADNRVAGDSLSTSYTSAGFADKNIGTAKPASVSGISVSGTDAANYTANTTASTTANITAASLTPLVTANNKVYDGNTNATIASRALNGVLGSDGVSLSGGSASFATKTVGTNKAVSVTGLSLSGADASNYQLASTSTSTTANITTRALSVTAAGVNKVYNGTTSATVTLADNRLGGDSLSTSYSNASFADKNVGTSKTVSVSGISVSGTDAANYSANTSASATADITAKALSVTATGVNKVYDGATTATVTLSDNRLAGDTLSTSYSSATFADKNVGTAKSVSVSGISVSGTDAANYSANTSASTTANITARTLTASGITASDKVYDASTSASLSTASAALVAVISGDIVSLNTGSAIGVFSDKNVGTGKTVNVSALSLSGADAGNYSLTQPTTTASISKAGLTVTADNKSRAAGAANPTLTASYSGFVGGETLATSGVTGNPALSTTTTNVAGTYPITAALGSLSAANYSFSFVNGVLTVTPASANSLVMLTQPSSMATAGLPFVQQPAVAIQDAYGNLRSSDNSTLVTAARNAGSGTLQGTLTATAVNGVATFVNLSHNVANAINLGFSTPGLTNKTSANILVSPAPFAQLQLLVPGESAAPGSASGKTGSPSAQIASTSFGMTVNAVDPFWNLINTVSDTVGLSSSDATATLPPVTVLAGGTTNLIVAFNTNGNFTLTASDLTDGTKSPDTSPAITVSPAQFTFATGGGAISADGATGAFTTLTGPTYSENTTNKVGTGTIILQAPTGFIFDTVGTAPTVLITRLTGSGSNINGVSSGTAVAMSLVTSTQMVFTVTSASASGTTCKLTWQNVRVRPTAGTPLASGTLSRSGTASVMGLSTNANLGILREVPGAANRLAIQTQPSAAATAGVAFAQQPVLQVRDQFSNLRTSDNSTVVTATRNAGSGALQGITNRTALNGVVTFTNLAHNVATNITISFSAPGVSSTNSSTVAISAAAADRLVFSAQPGSTTYGLALSPQPVLKSRDPFGNDSSVGLGASQLVTLSVSAGTGSLLGTASLDIGTAAGNGIVSFSGLQVSTAGTNKQLSAGASGLTSALSSSFDVAKATVIGSITANNKIYDGTTGATIATRSLSGALAGDDVTLSGGTASFASKSVGTAKTVTASGLSLSGLGASNYQLASTSATSLADITARALTVSATGVNKGYDGTSTATVTLSDNRVAGDSLAASYASASFADKNIGTAKSVSVSGIALSGADAANYSANTTASTTANITARSLNVTATGANKVYDGTSDASVALSDNRVAGDSLATSYTNANFATKFVGTNKTVSISGITVTGTDASNYTANTTASATANIIARSLSVTASGTNKVYDATTTATVTLSDDRVSGDSLTDAYISASFANKTVGSAKTVSVSGISISGTDAGNYTANTTATTTASITARSLTVTATGLNKVYDATTAATVTLSDNRVSGDSLSTTYTSASFTDKNVGTAKIVSVSGIAISGTDAPNYAANTTASATANITTATLTTQVSVSNKVYDGTTAATVLTNSLNSVLLSDNVSLTGGAASFANKNVGTNKTVTVTGLNLAGTDAANYQLGSSSTTTTANITPRSLTVTATGINKTYDATTNATVTLSDNRVSGDSFTDTYTNASFADKNVGSAKPVSVAGITISGTDAPNYTANTTASATANITARSLTVIATGVNKVYDATTNGTVTLADNRLAGDSLTDAYTSAGFANKNVGTNKILSVSGITISGADAGNYTANTTTNTTANITAKGLMVAGITANNKVYDATTSATLNTAGATLSGVISGDSVSLNATSATGAFADKNAGTVKTLTISGLGLSSTDAGNYALSQPTAIANITQAPLTVTANNQTRAAGQPNPALTASYTGFVGGETLATSGVSGSPALSTTTTNVAGTYPITASQGSLSALNYSFSFVNGVLTVTPASPSTLVTLTQPSSSATAGVPFAQQPAIGIQDAYGNLLNTNGLVVTAARGAGTGTLQGTLTASTVNGVAAFGNLSHNVVNTINLSFSTGGLTNVTSANVLVSPAAFSQLQLLVPGQTAAPGTTNGVTGTPSAQVADTGFPVTVNAVDAYYNLVGTVSDTVGLSASDTTATLPPATALAAGTTNLTVYFNAGGSFTLTATDLSDNTKTPNTSPAITVGPARFTPATGGGAISADSTGGTWTSLTGPTYSENAFGNIGTGTIILNAPKGFIFDTGGTAPTVKITSGGSSSKNINGVSSGTAVAMTSVTTTQLTFTVTSSSGVTNTLTWQSVRVRSSAGTPLASGSLRLSGTATVFGVSTNSNFGWLAEVAGAANNLAIQTQPSATATAGVRFVQQPALQVRDQFGNLRSSANGVSDSTLVSAARSAGSGTLQGTLNATATNGVATFTNLSHNVATNITLAFSASGLIGTDSSAIAVGPAAASQLVFATQPGNGTVGVPLATQPVLIARDPFGNNSAVGLGPSKNVTLTLSSGSGPLLGTATLDIGSSAGNGVAAFTNLSVGSAATNDQFTTSTVGLSSAASSFFSIVKNGQTITFGGLANQAYGNAPFTVSATASSGLPVTFSIVSGPATLVANTVTITGVGTVTVQAAQAGDTAWAAATPVVQSFTVAKATLTVTADNKNRGYGTANPVLTASYAGFVNGQNASVLSGSPSLSTTATLSSSVSGSPYPITVTQGTLTASNYNFIFVPGALTITKAPLTVTAVNQVRSYGAPNPPMTASYTGFVNGQNASVLSGSPTLSTTATAASPVVGSPYPITITQGTLAAANYSFSFNAGSLTVTRANLTVAADNQARAYGATNPPLTVTYTGFVNGEDTNMLSGNPALSTTADTNSPVGNYPITINPGTLSATNYTVSFVDGTLSITMGSSSVAVATSANPSPTGSNVTFTATVSAISPSTGIPHGTVQFKADGSPLSSPAGLSLGVASLTLSSLVHGTHTITVEYAGDGKFLASTNGLGSSQIINTPPVASPATYTRAANSSLEIMISDLLTNYTSDCDGDSRTFVSVGTGTNGAAIILSTNSISYLPSDTNPNRNATDHFDYIITDCFGGCLATNQIAVLVSNPAPSPANLTGIMVITNGIQITFAGSPGCAYHVERSATLQSSLSVWQDLGPVTTDGVGEGKFIDHAPPADHAFYRIVWP